MKLGGALAPLSFHLRRMTIPLRRLGVLPSSRRRPGPTLPPYGFRRVDIGLRRYDGGSGWDGAGESAVVLAQAGTPGRPVHRTVLCSRFRGNDGEGNPLRPKGGEGDRPTAVQFNKSVVQFLYETTKMHLARPWAGHPRLLFRLFASRTSVDGRDRARRRGWGETGFGGVTHHHREAAGDSRITPADDGW